MNYFLLLIIIPVLTNAIEVENEAVYKAEKRLLYKRSLELVDDADDDADDDVDDIDEDVPEEIADPVRTEWIVQKLDNFDPQNQNKWNMRYMSNTQNFKPHSPIFIYVGGEWTISSGPIVAGHFYDIGKELNAAFYYTEHRFYGQNKPTNDLSQNNLKFLSVGQALADLAHFIRTLKSKPEMKNSKVIISSGSYGGNMVTWFKKMYPDLISGAWASCAPVLAKVDYVEYSQVAGRSIYSVCGAAVYNRIQNGFRVLENLYDNNYEAFRTKLNICPNFDKNNQYNMWEMFKTIANFFNNNIQGASYFFIKSGICDTISNYKGTDEDAVANYFLKAMKAKQCISQTFTNRVRYYAVTDWNYWAKSHTNDRSWMWQVCSEFGYFQTSSATQPLGSRYPVQYFLKQCQDLFGFSSNTVYANIEASNRLYGGLNPQVKNVFWSHGGLDPWSSLGIHHNNGKNNIMPWYTHMEDNGSINPTMDTPQMVELKQDVRRAIRSYLGIKN